MSQQLKKAGLKVTQSRLRVLEALRGLKQPATAEALHRLTQPMALSTVYRVLDAFEKKGIAKRSLLAGTERSVYELAGASHRHYAVCVACHKVIPLAFCPMKAPVQPEGFRVIGHRFELSGYCADCDARPGKEAEQ